MIDYECPHCGKKVQIPEQYAGQAGAAATPETPLQSLTLAKIRGLK